MLRALFVAFFGSSEESLISRSTIIILSAILIGIGAGSFIGQDVASLCGFAGLAGLASHCGLALTAYMRQNVRHSQVEQQVTQRLVRHRRQPPRWSAIESQAMAAARNSDSSEFAESIGHAQPDIQSL